MTQLISTDRGEANIGHKKTVSFKTVVIFYGGWLFGLNDNLNYLHMLVFQVNHFITVGAT